MKRTFFLAICFILVTISVSVAFVACEGRQDDNAPAFAMISHSRHHLAAGEYQAARDTILAMRSRYPAAVQARAAGLLLLDSIELTAARDSLGTATEPDRERLSLKCRFFERKLQEDLKKKILRQ